MKSLIVLFALALVYIAGCGGSPKPISTVPLVHRATADPCPSPRPAASCTDGPGPSPSGCVADADCSDASQGTEGRCTSSRFGCTCTYDTCDSDADCSTGTLCSCRGPSQIVNSCLPTDCRLDSDCGAHGYCSPSLDPTCGVYFGVTAWHCHTPKDKCMNDSDCAGLDGGFVAPFCGYSPTVGYWACIATACAG